MAVDLRRRRPQVVVSEEVAQAVDGFSYEDMGPVTLKGVTAPMRLFRAAR